MEELPSSPAAALETEMRASPMVEEPHQLMDETVAPMNEMSAHLMSDEPRLVETLKECFANLTKGNESQTEKLLEALKPKTPPTTDKETTFWNAYKTLSEEYDQEFHTKYGTDLDTSLIFAGLFSAVGSAFIIQIQPELKQDPNEVTQQLLQILIHNANQSLFSGIDMAEPSSGITTTIIIVQSLFYASLFSTLLAAFLAVLGKQWLMHYDAAGSRGTLAERGLERQRKYDGLHKWKFTFVMEMFPLLLQLALLLFSAALSVYLHPGIHFSVGLCSNISRFTIPDPTFQCFAQSGDEVMGDTASFTPFSSSLPEESFWSLGGHPEVSTTAVNISSIATISPPEYLQ
ncbi:hypothetical protein C8J57DRAFT_1614158 [Mycena rebaudengoi]|nr:hypothetical protein C8J57DRAFT_1614158 [Mycena rebaudengoi]